MANEQNPLGLLGIEFTEFASPDTDFMHQTFIDFGFSMREKVIGKAIYHYQQNDIHFLLNRQRQGFSAEFSRRHGPAICSMGWRVEDAHAAYRTALARVPKRPIIATEIFPTPQFMGLVIA